MKGLSTEDRRKLLALRFGAEFPDESDAVFLLSEVGVNSSLEALNIIAHYFPQTPVPPKTNYLLKDLYPD